MKKIIRFPQDFEKSTHELDNTAVHYTNYYFSVIFGGKHFYSDGIDTYEMFNLINGDVIGWATIDEINKYLETINLEYYEKVFKLINIK